jgi:hypothetical protein
MFLPDEIINLILSYREINPVALLIRESIDKYNKTARINKLHCYHNKLKEQSYFFHNEVEMINEKWDIEID